jgi:cytochrome c-type biogenesis protein CcmF
VADIQLDGGSVYAPALSKFPNSTDAVGTPAVHTSFTQDVYMTLVRLPSAPGDATVLSVIVQPLVSWLWFGGLMMAVGTALALVPSSRRNASDLDAVVDAPVDLTELEKEPVLS